MNPDQQPPQQVPHDPSAEIAFVHEALAAADRSERFSRVIVGLLAILAIVVFFWMHLHMFPPQSLGELLHTLLRVDLFFLVMMLALTMYLRQEMNKNTRIVLRALANARQR